MKVKKIKKTNTSRIALGIILLFILGFIINQSFNLVDLTAKEKIIYDEYDTLSFSDSNNIYCDGSNKEFDVITVPINTNLENKFIYTSNVKLRTVCGENVNVINSNNIQFLTPLKQNNLNLQDLSNPLKLKWREPLPSNYDSSTKAIYMCFTNLQDNLKDYTLFSTYNSFKIYYFKSLDFIGSKGQTICSQVPNNVLGMVTGFSSMDEFSTGAKISGYNNVLMSNYGESDSQLSFNGFYMADITSGVTTSTYQQTVTFAVPQTIIPQQLHYREYSCPILSGYSLVSQTFTTGTYNLNDFQIKPNYFCNSNKAIISDVSSTTSSQPYLDLINKGSFSVINGQTITLFYVTNQDIVPKVCEDVNILNSDDCFTYLNTNIDSLNIDLQAKVQAINDLNVNIQEKEDLIKQLTPIVEEQISLIAQLELSNDEQLQVIDDLNLNINQQALYIQQLNNTVTENAILINQLQLNVQEQAQLISQLQLTSQEQSDLINQLSLTIEQKNVLIAELQETVLQQQTQIIQFEGTITQLASDINSLQLTVDQQIEYINSLNLNIEEQAQLINELTSNLELKALYVNQLQVENEKQAQLINEMKLSFESQGIIIDNLEKTIQDDSVIISSLTSKVDEQGQIITGMSLTITEQKQLIQSLTSKVEEQGIIISNMKLTLTQQTQLINQLTNVNEEQAIIINQLQLSNQEQGIIIDSLNKNLQEKLQIITLLEDNVKNQAEIVANMKLTIEEQVIAINTLSKNLDDKVILIQKLTDSLEQEKALTQELTQNIQERDDIIAELEREAKMKKVYTIGGIGAGIIAFTILLI